jgi:hypothetical protein
VTAEATAGSEVGEILDPVGSCLYHYTRLSTALEHILPVWRMLMNPFSKMRDPRESRRWGFEATRSNLGIREDIRRFAELNQKGEQLKDRFKVLSLTQDDPAARPADSEIFGRGYAHPRLWEHYAGDHRGVCLCFDRETLTKMLVHDLAGHGEVHHRPVRYVDAEIAVEARRFLMDELKDLPVDDALREHVAKHLDVLFFTKLRDWETEFEYRFVLEDRDADPVLVEVRNSMRAIIIGEDVSPSYVPALQALCDQVDARILRIRWQNARPWLQDPTAPGYS